MRTVFAAAIPVVFAVWTYLIVTRPVVYGGLLATAAACQLTCLLLLLAAKNRHPFEPFVWFAGMFFLLPLMAGYMAIGDFGRLYHDNVAFSSERLSLVTAALFVALAGLVSFWLGDSGARRADASSAEPVVDGFHFGKDVYLWLTVIFYSVGFANFFINALIYDASNPLALLYDFGARDNRLENLPQTFTTIGYTLLFCASALHLYYRLIFHSRIGTIFYLAAFAVLVVLLSTGRVWYTFSIGLALFGSWYISGRDRKVGKAVFAIAGIAVLVIGGFVLRLVSNLLYIEDDGGGLGTLDISFRIAENLSYFIIGRSNVPSLPILAEVISHYGKDQPFLYGETLTYWSTYLLPGIDVKYLGHEIKELFYAGRPGGFPPTVFGEFYANGGIVFVCAGCFALGFACRALFEAAVRSPSFLTKMIYAAILFRFVFMLPKLETAAFGSALWLVLPVAAVWGLLTLASRSTASLRRPAALSGEAG